MLLSGVGMFVPIPGMLVCLCTFLVRVFLWCFLLWWYFVLIPVLWYFCSDSCCGGIFVLISVVVVFLF